MSLLTITDEVLLAFAEEVGSDGEVTVEGGRTRWMLGGEVAPTARLVTAPEGVVSYQPDEMTVQVRVGTTVEELHAELAKHGQRTSLPERRGTVGGALAVGESAVESLGRGPIRNALLQVRYVSAEGQLVTGGGPTVKNVTGYNLPKMLVGSLGTLGLMAEVILRTNPTPDTSRWLKAEGADPFAVYDALLRPGAIMWDGSATWVLLEGHGVDVDAEQQRLTTHGSFAEVEGLPALPGHRWSLTPKDLRGANAETHGSFVASIGTGMLYSDQPAPQQEVARNVAEVSKRAKLFFDPTGRLNPGRNPLKARS